MRRDLDSFVWIGAVVAVAALGLCGYLVLPRSNYVTPSGQNPLRPHAGQPVSYLLVKTDNLDMAANRKRSLRIIVPVGISRADLEATLRQAVTDERRREAAVDEVRVFAYGPNDDTQGEFTYGKLDWTSEGKDSAVIAPGVAEKK